MKRIFVLFFAILCSYMISLYASSEQEDNPGQSNPSNPSLRPKAPARKPVSCVYATGYIYMSFASPEGECIASIIADGIPMQAISFDSSTPMPIFIGEANCISIALFTESGNTYYVNI